MIRWSSLSPPQGHQSAAQEGKIIWFVDGLKKNSAGETNYMIGQESDIATGVYSETGQQV